MKVTKHGVDVTGKFLEDLQRVTEGKTAIHFPKEETFGRNPLHGVEVETPPRGWASRMIDYVINGHDKNRIKLPNSDSNF